MQLRTRTVIEEILHPKEEYKEEMKRIQERKNDGWIIKSVDIQDNGDNLVTWTKEVYSHVSA